MTMKHKTAELTGALLDAAVAMAEGKLYQVREVMSADYRSRFDACLVAEHGAEWSKRTTDYKFFHPSTRWEHGGPLIERERLELRNDASGGWNCMGNGCYGEGPTPLVAAMRAYVVSKLGEDVDLSKVGADPRA